MENDTLQPLRIPQEGSKSSRPPSMARSPYDIMDYPSVQPSSIPMRRDNAIPPLTSEEIKEAIEKRPRQHAGKFTIDIRPLDNPTNQMTFRVSRSYTLLELYALLYFECRNRVHPEQMCLYWQTKLLDLSQDSAKMLRDLHIRQDSTLILSQSPPRAFAEVVTPQRGAESPQPSASLSVAKDSQLIVHTLVSPSSVRCSAAGTGKTGIVPLSCLKITKIFDHSLAEELAKVSGTPQRPVDPAPFRHESITLDGSQLHGLFASLMNCCGLLKRSTQIRAPLYLPPWSPQSIVDSSEVTLPHTEDPHFLLTEDFSATVVAFEVRSIQIESSDSRPSMAIDVKCSSHGEERISFVTLEVSLPENEKVVGIAPEELSVGPVDAATISATHAASASAGITMDVGVDGGKLGAKYKQTAQHQVDKTFTGQVRCRISGVMFGHSKAVWTMKENQNQLEGLPRQTNLAMEFNHKPRTVFISYRIAVAKPDGRLEERKNATCLLFP